MIIQQFLDLMRDVFVNWLSGIASLWPAASVDDVLSSFGVPSAQMGAVLAILYTASGWGIIISVLSTSIALFIITVPMKAILARIRT